MSPQVTGVVGTSAASTVAHGHFFAGSQIWEDKEHTSASRSSQHVGLCSPVSMKGNIESHWNTPGFVVVVVVGFFL